MRELVVSPQANAWRIRSLRAHEEIIIKADKALYQSKQNGRNRVTAWGATRPWCDHPDSSREQNLRPSATGRSAVLMKSSLFAAGVISFNLLFEQLSLVQISIIPTQFPHQTDFNHLSHFHYPNG